jgi:hypothetical protein
MNATRVSSHDAYRAGPDRPPRFCTSPSSNPICDEASRVGSVPVRDRRSCTALAAARMGLRGSRPGLSASAATGSPGCGQRSATFCQITQMAAPAPATTRMSSTSHVGVPGHARSVRSWAMASAKSSPNRLICPPVSAPASFADSQRIPRPPIGAQHPNRISHPPAAPVCQIEAFGPSVPLIPGSRPGRHGWWGDQSRGLRGVISHADYIENAGGLAVDGVFEWFGGR